MMNVFRNQILSLASPAETQLGLHPQGVCVGDELVCDFDRHRELFLDHHDVNSEQLNAIRMLDAYLDDLSGPQNESFWCDREPIESDPRWQQIREYAQRVLATMEWEYSQPISHDDIYVFEPEPEND